MDRWDSLSIDPDIAAASTLPAWVYSDPSSLERARETVFTPSWQWVGDVASVRVPGQVHPFTLLEGLLDEPLVFTRDRDDTLHCLSNVCTHRGTLVCEGDGVLPQLRCRYHGRRFSLDGKFHSMPEFEQAAGFPSPADDLPRARFGDLRGTLLFASLAPRVPLETLLEPVLERCGALPFEHAVFDPRRSRDYLVHANWALYVDNFLEGFHIPYVHAGLADALDYGAYRTELHPWGNLQLGVAADGEDAFDLPAGSPDHGQRIAAYWFWLFPNTMINLYPWGISVNAVQPLAADRTKVLFRSYVWDASKLDRGAGGAIDRVEREDEAIVESVQRGVRSRLYTRGRYSPTREAGVHQFHQLLAAALRG